MKTASAIIFGMLLTFATFADEVYLSAGVGDVVKLSQAEVSVAVIKNYVASSAVPYSLSADDIIYLKKSGIADEIVAAMINRGAEVQKQTAVARVETPRVQTPQQIVSTPAAPVNQVVSYPVYTPVITQPIYTSPSYYYSYPYPSYSYYPSCSFNAGYPFYGYRNSCGYSYRNSYGYSYRNNCGYSYPSYRNNCYGGFGVSARVGGFSGRFGSSSGNHGFSSGHYSRR